MSIFKKRINQKPEIVNPINEWHKYVITYIDTDNYPRVVAEITHEPIEDFTKWACQGKILSIKEIEGTYTSGECSYCKNPFKVGDIIYDYKMNKHTIVFIDQHLAYFSESRSNDVGIDAHDQMRYLIHANHVSEEQLELYKKGTQLWDEGMRICHDIEKQLFKW